MDTARMNPKDRLEKKIGGLPHLGHGGILFMPMEKNAAIPA